MESIKKIVFCTDFSENADRAFDMAFDLAQKYQAQLFLIHVFPPLAYPYTAMEDFISEKANLNFLEEAIKRAMAQIENSYVQKMGDYKNASLRVLSGHPASEILKFVEQEKADLVVMGALGRTGLGHFLLGSVTEKVVRRAECAVLTVHKAKQ